MCKDNSINYVNECSASTSKLPTIHKSKYQEIVVMCGFPGSGKSTLAQSIFGHDSDYIIVSKDIHKARAMSNIKKSY